MSAWPLRRRMASSPFGGIRIRRSVFISILCRIWIIRINTQAMVLDKTLLSLVDADEHFQSIDRGRKERPRADG